MGTPEAAVSFKKCPQAARWISTPPWSFSGHREISVSPWSFPTASWTTSSSSLFSHLSAYTAVLPFFFSPSSAYRAFLPFLLFLAPPCFCFNGLVSKSCTVLVLAFVLLLSDLLFWSFTFLPSFDVRALCIPAAAPSWLPASGRPLPYQLGRMAYRPWGGRPQALCERNKY